MDSSGNIGTQGSVSSGAGSTSSGQIEFFGATTPYGNLTILAPPSFGTTTALSQTWILPSGPLPTGSSILQLSGGGSSQTLNYVSLIGSGGISVTPGSGSYVFSLSGSLNLPGTTPTLNDSGGNIILALSSSGAGNYVKITNDTSGTNPAAGPVIAAAPGAGMASYLIPLQLSDANGGGVELNSNGVLALRAVNLGASANFVTANASPPGTFSGAPGVRVGAAAAGGSGNVALVLQGQNNGTVYVNSNLDTANAVVIDLPVDSTGVTANTLTILTSAGNARTAGTGGGAIIAGVALTTTMSGTAPIAYSGKVVCAFDATPTPGHSATPSTTIAGDCHDTAAYTSTLQTIGIVLDSSGTILMRH